MVAKLIVRVQADFLPQLTDASGAVTSQVGVRLSALVDLPVGDALPISLADLLPDLCPWLWLSMAPGIREEWTPHDPAAWRLFRLDGAVPVEITTKLPRPTDLDPGTNAEFAAAVEETLAVIVDEGGQAAVCTPPNEMPVEHRTVFGMIESLTGLPHPVPAGMRIFTVLSVAEDLSGVRMVAIPRFRLPNGGSFDIDGATFADTDPASVITADSNPLDPSPWASSVRFQLRASLAVSEMTRAAGSTRLIDLSTLSIGATGQATEVGDEDYAAHLPARLAEALDPAARLIGALDGVVHALRASVDETDKEAFAQLRADLAGAAEGKPSALLALLEAMTNDVFRPMARASEAVQSVALSRFGIIAQERGSDGLRTAVAHSAGQVFLRMLDRDDSAHGFVSDGPRSPLMSLARLGATVGIPPERIARAAVEPTALDSEAGFVEFVRSHWLEPLAPVTHAARPLVVGAPRRLAAKFFSAQAFPLAVGYEAILDARIMAAPGPRFLLKLLAVGDAAQLKIGATSLLFARSSDASITVSAVGGAQRDVILQADVALTFALTLSTDRSTLAIGFDTAADPLEISAPDLARGPFEITFEAVAGSVADAQPLPADAAQVRRFADLLTAQGTRTDLSLAFAGPFLPGVLGGREDWSGAPWSPSGKGVAEAIRDGVSALVPQLYKLLSNATPVPPWLERVVDRVIDTACDDAVQLAIAAVPSIALDRITMDAPPLVVRIDQFQEFGADDAWSRAAGYGALIGRSKTRPGNGSTPREWWTLNTAELFAVSPKGSSKPKSLGVVDPVAIQVGQGGGVRQSLLSYNNRWLATGLVSDTMQGGDVGRPVGPRRPERLEPPSAQAGYTLPALSCGYSFWVLPYVIGHGGVLPLWLRKNIANPLVRRGCPGKRIIDALEGAVGDARSSTYLRTRPIGAPRIVDERDKPALPPVPENIAPLAAELAIRPPPITLEPGQSAMFYRDVSGQRGVLSWQTPVNDELAGFRILLGDVGGPGSTYATSRTAVSKLRIVLWGTKGDAVSPEPLWTAIVENVAHDLRLSLLVNHDGSELTSQMERQSAAPALAEDEGLFEVMPASVSPAGTWRDMFVEIAIPETGSAAQFEPPVVVDVQRGKDDDPKLVQSLVTSKPNIPPEVSHRSRIISLFDQINHAIQHRLPDAVTLRRPGVEFGTYERWINPALIETEGGPETRKDDVREALNKAYELATREPQNAVEKRDVSFEDPAVTALGFELVEIFPHRKAIGLVVGRTITGIDVFAAHIRAVGPNDERHAKVDFDYASPAQLRATSTGARAVLEPGRIYELRSYAVVADAKQDFSPFETLDRMSGPVRATFRKVEIGGVEYHLASANVTTIEVATSEMPDVYAGSFWSRDDRLIELDRPPGHREDIARIYLPKALAAPLASSEEIYRKVRYAATASLYSQRWSWRGHPQAEIAPRSPSAALLNDPWTHALAETAFTGRRNEDVGDVIVRRLEKAHIYGGRANLSERLPSPPSTALFTKALDWRAGLNLWRFGFSLTSRYAPLFPRQIPSERMGHLGPLGDAWAVQAIPDRPGGRTIARPGLALVLPLTEPLMAGGATPPLLALFNDRVYSNFNLADGIDVAVEVARHPFTVAEQKAELKRLKDDDEDKHADAIRELEHRLQSHIPSPTDGLKHWQEFGPDPIRTGAAHDGGPILLRTDGPLGYTFDAETDAGRFDHAGLLISPVGQDYRPWSMIKLRFRRFEAPEALAGYRAVAISSADVSVPLSGRHFPIPSDGASVDFEGLVVEIGSLAGDDETTVALSLGAYIPPAEQPIDTDPARPSVAISARRDGGKLTISARTLLGDAGTVTVAISPQETAHVRLVLSGKERPEGVERWTPQGDVAIKLKIVDPHSGVDVLERLDRDRWLAVNCVPLTGIGHVGVTDIVAARIRTLSANSKVEVGLRPARLSAFSPSIWCQFAESMSVLSATLGKDDEKQRSISVGDLVATPVVSSGNITGLALTIKTPTGEAALPPIRSLATSFETDVDAQVDQILLAVVTRYVTDAFARLRERPLGVVHLTDGEHRPLLGDGKNPFVVGLSADTAEKAWWGDEDGPVRLGIGGRLRFLRMLVPRPRALGGFVDAPSRKLSDLFNQGLLTPDDMNPSDAAGQVLGISQPVEWR